MKNNHEFQCRDKGRKSEAILQKQHFEKFQSSQHTTKTQTI